MLFANRIKELRESKQMLQRHISTALDIDNVMYCKIERGDRQAKREQIPLISKILQVDTEELLTLWLADQIIEIIENEKGLASKVMIVVQKFIKE